MALPANSQQMGFIISFPPRIGLKVALRFKSKAGIQKTTVKEMKHNVNIWLIASLLELDLWMLQLTNPMLCSTSKKAALEPPKSVIFWMLCLHASSP